MPAPEDEMPWLCKTEPSTWSVDDHARAPQRTTFWDGVRNYQARNTLRDSMRLGDPVLLYHSSCEPSGVVGLCEVASAPYPDPTAFDPADPHHDPKSDPSNPTWFGVDLRLVERFSHILSLADLKADPGLAGLELLRKGSRLSVQPVSDAHLAHILRLARA